MKEKICKYFRHVLSLKGSAFFYFISFLSPIIRNSKEVLQEMNCVYNSTTLVLSFHSFEVNCQSINRLYIVFSQKEAYVCCEEKSVGMESEEDSIIRKNL